MNGKWMKMRLGLEIGYVGAAPRGRPSFSPDLYKRLS